MGLDIHLRRYKDGKESSVDEKFEIVSSKTVSSFMAQVETKDIDYNPIEDEATRFRPVDLDAALEWVKFNVDHEVENISYKSLIMAITLMKNDESLVFKEDF